jgi:DNA-binding response OmpR family regulator
LLDLLAVTAGQWLTRDEISDHLWGIKYAAESNVVVQEMLVVSQA